MTFPMKCFWFFFFDLPQFMEYYAAIYNVARSIKFAKHDKMNMKNMYSPKVATRKMVRENFAYDHGQIVRECEQTIQDSMDYLPLLQKAKTSCSHSDSCIGHFCLDLLIYVIVWCRSQMTLESLWEHETFKNVLSMILKNSRMFCCSNCNLFLQPATYEIIVLVAKHKNLTKEFLGIGLLAEKLGFFIEVSSKRPPS